MLTKYLAQVIAMIGIAMGWFGLNVLIVLAAVGKARRRERGARDPSC
jgi:hypothetical protein